VNEKGSMIAEIGDSARDGISYAQFGSERAVLFWGFIEVRRTVGSVRHYRGRCRRN